ncbi:sulfurtransferase [Tenacibaculum sp. Bg11-29]|uniref:sulfurtransferase n=1 Tax=Tenacibaculum sp. Bg11-29 TaxID=2058306 RepID=UPI000C3427EA|nr:sulfurtransferase [Tenacibaculum sp. Bg11-29]PKH51262.1 sulfurtransferase [Tenacibaculum sp. Bg11-29]
MKLKVPSPLVTVNWLSENINAENLIVLDATIPKVGGSKGDEKERRQILNTVFFDLKNVFLDSKGVFPNTIPNENHFEKQARELGVNNDSCIVVYDDIGVYSSARAWWLFKIFGFKNVAVLNGGLPKWQELSFLTEEIKKTKIKKGDFKVNFNVEKVSGTIEVLKASNDKKCILDARSKARFNATVAEPRKGLRGGHIPNSKSLPYTELQVNGKMKSVKELKEIFLDLNPKKENVVFSCGSGITACILALGNEVAGNENYTVFDGSWTEWASNLELPIEK